MKKRYLYFSKPHNVSLHLPKHHRFKDIVVKVNVIEWDSNKKWVEMEMTQNQTCKRFCNIRK